MQAFYFTKSVTLHLGGEVKPFVAPIDTSKAPLEEIWVDTKHNCGKLNNYVQRLGPVSPDNPMFDQGDWRLPVRLNGDPDQTCLLHDDCPQMQTLKTRLYPGKKLRVALFNAFGTGLGDNFVGMQMFQLALMRLRTVQPDIEIDVFRTWKSPKPDYILKNASWVNQIRTTPINLKHLLDYDAYYDFSDFANLPGFLTRPWPDFQLINLGIDPQTVPKAFKQARYEVCHQADFDRGMKQLGRYGLRSKTLRVFVHARASTYLRSIPPSALELLLNALQANGHHLVTDDDLVAGVAKENNLACLYCHGQTLDELCGLVHACDVTISSDTFLLHVANAVSKKVIGLFVTTRGYQDGLMLPYQANLTTINVDSENRVSAHNKMTREALVRQGHHDYFVESWEAAIDRAVKQLLDGFCKVEV
jgi:hypothetical protein